MALKRKLSAGRIWITNEFFIVICWVISVLLPKRRWYGAVLAFARLLAHTAGSFAPETSKASDASLVPRLLHRFLDILAVRDRYFPIPLVVEGQDFLEEYASQPGGFVICSAHIPFVKVIFPLVRKTVGDHRDIRVVAREPEGDNEVTTWNDISLKAILTDHAVLLHTRTLLRKNGCLLLAVDKEQGEFISSNIFRFVGKMNSRILMFFTQLQPDGRILVRIMLPPGPRCRTEDEIRANLDFVAENVRRILQGDELQAVTRTNPVLERSLEGERSREIHRIQLYSNMQLEARMKRLEALLAEHTNGTSQRELLKGRLELMRSELETRAGV